MPTGAGNPKGGLAWLRNALQTDPDNRRCRVCRSQLGGPFSRGIFGLTVTCFDNLKRRGSELNIVRLKRAGIDFLHGDIRCREDVEACPAFDLLIDCSAEPSVQSGIDGSPFPVIQNNLTGTVNCLEAAAARGPRSCS